MQTLAMIGIHSSVYYDWYARRVVGRIDALADRSPRPKSAWNRIPNDIRDKTTRPNELWQTDFSYPKVSGWGWLNLSTILDDYSRYIIAWKLCTTVKAADVTDRLELALCASACNSARVDQKPTLLGDNGSSCVAVDLNGKSMDHVRSAPHHPQTQSRIERWHQTMKNGVLSENNYLPGDLEHQISTFVDHYNKHRYNESRENQTPADVCHGRGARILKIREEIKKQTIR